MTCMVQPLVHNPAAKHSSVQCQTAPSRTSAETVATSTTVQLATAHLQLPTCNCQLATANLQLPIRSCQLATAHLQLPTCNCQLATANLQVPTCNCPLDTLKSQSAVGVEVEGAPRDVLPLALQVIRMQSPVHVAKVGLVLLEMGVHEQDDGNRLLGQLNVWVATAAECQCAIRVDIEGILETPLIRPCKSSPMQSPVLAMLGNVTAMSLSATDSQGHLIS
jgi:hypothetical protein